MNRIRFFAKLGSFAGRSVSLALAGLLMTMAFSAQNSQAGTGHGERDSTFAFVFKESGQNISGTQYYGEGYATHLGAYASTGLLVGSDYNITYTSPEGDELFGSYGETELGLENGILYAFLKGTFSGGTGIYAGAVCDFEGVVAVDLADGVYNAVGGGMLTLPADDSGNSGR